MNTIHVKSVVEAYKCFITITDIAIFTALPAVYFVTAVYMPAYAAVYGKKSYIKFFINK